MLAYSWPGNVRELQNTVERAVILTAENLPVSPVALGLPVLSRPVEAPFPAMPTEDSPAKAPENRSGQEQTAPAAPPPDWSTAFSPIKEEPTVPSGPPPPDRNNLISPAESPIAPEPDVLPLDEIEKRHILVALRHTNANRTRAAALLGISIRTLRNKLQEYRAAGIVIEGDESSGE
jgi:DNA-binding NtrC family response regulator